MDVRLLLPLDGGTVDHVCHIVLASILGTFPDHNRCFGPGRFLSQGPDSPWSLSPCVGGHEGPSGEAILVFVVVWTLAQDHCSENIENCSDCHQI